MTKKEIDQNALQMAKLEVTNLRTFYMALEKICDRIIKKSNKINK